LQLIFSKNYQIDVFSLENLKNIVSFTRFLKKDMYNSPLYGKEWSWRNIKMEARESHIDLRP